MKAPVKKFNLRIPVDLMEQAQQEAEAMGVSLNAYCLLAIRNFVQYTQRGRPKPAQPAKATAPTGTSRTDSTRVGRNDPCPCGSGRKAKHCHPENC